MVYFIDYRCSIKEHIGKMNIFIKDYTSIIIKNDTKQIQLERYRTILLDKNDQMDTCFPIKWEEKSVL